MEKDGVFVFDLNTPYKHEKVLSGQTFDFDEDDAACRWSNRYDPQTGRVDLSIDIHYKDTGKTSMNLSRNTATRLIPSKRC